MDGLNQILPKSPNISSYPLQDYEGIGCGVGPLALNLLEGMIVSAKFTVGSSASYALLWLTACIHMCPFILGSCVSSMSGHCLFFLTTHWHKFEHEAPQCNPPPAPCSQPGAFVSLFPRPSQPIATQWWFSVLACLSVLSQCHFGNSKYLASSKKPVC